MAAPRRTRPYRKVTVSPPYRRWKETHPGETLTYRGWLEVQVATARETLHRLKRELAEETTKEASG